MTALIEKGKYLVKGTVIANLRSYVDARMYDGYYLEIARKIEFGSGNLIVKSSWYDGEKSLLIFMQAAKDLGISLKELTVEFARHNLETDLKGVYKFFMRLGGAERVLASSSQMVKAYTNYHVYDTLENAKGIHIAKSTCPEHLAEFTMHINEGSIKGVLNTCHQPMKNFELIDQVVFEKDGESLSSTNFKVTY